MSLPVERVIPELLCALTDGNRAVLQAPPGAGKTTRVPLALLDQPWLGGRRVVMLEPRRLAARAAARFMSEKLGENIGKTVGYRVKLDSRVSTETRIEVVTEGVLTRLLQDDPELAAYGAVIFDEFHERSLQGDLGLALTLDSQQSLRTDLRVLVMSATLDGQRVAELLEQAPVITSRGRSHPVDVRYRPGGRGTGLPGRVAAVVQEALAEETGSALVFLPGQREISQVMQLLTGRVGDDVSLLPLYGNLPFAAQDQALTPSPPGQRKVVLATNIAETSLTIDGIRVVVDAGLERSSRFDTASGMSRLITQRIARSSTEQRAGRAGRQGPGVCYRLWSAEEQARLQPFAAPEITRADLAPLVLELACWGVHEPESLCWLDPPPRASWNQATDLLGWLGFLDGDGRLTPQGSEAGRLGVHPRLAHLLLEGRALGQGWLACCLAALLSERDLLAAEPDAGSDMTARLRALEGGQGRARYVLELARRFAQRLGCEPGRPSREGPVGQLLAMAYPDRVASRRSGQDGRFLLRNGRGAWLPPEDPLGFAPMLVAAHLEGSGEEARIRLAAPVDETCIRKAFADQLRTEDEVQLVPASGRVQARRRLRLGALVLEEKALPTPGPEAVQMLMLEAMRERGLHLLPWCRETRQLQARVALLRELEPEKWPDLDDAGLLEDLETWCAPFLSGIRSLDGLQAFPLRAALESLLDFPQRRRLRQEAPTHWELSTGSRIRIDYGAGDVPVLAVRLQELFGCTESPTVARGRVPLLLHLLSPAGRPVQITQDLPGFWKAGYHDVRKELRGRYPKHAWPDDPLRAEPVRGVRRRTTGR